MRALHQQGNSPDGPFKILHYGKEKGNETYFVIFADDGIVKECFFTTGRNVDYLLALWAALASKARTK